MNNSNYFNKNMNSSILNGDNAVALYDFNGCNSDELCIRKNEYIIVTDWTFKTGWAYGYKKDDPHKKGVFPSSFVSKGLL